MADLYPVFDVPAILEETETNEAIYKGSAFFDFETGDFVLTGGGSMVEATGYEAWKQWCQKTIATQRAAFAAYTDGLGIEGEEAMAEKSAALQQTALESTIQEALLADPYGRTMEVRDFTWRREGDSLYLHCTVLGQDDKTAGIDMKLYG